MRASKFIALIAAAFAIVGLFVPIARIDAGLSPWSLLGDGGVPAFLVVLTFLPFVGIAIHAVIGIRRRSYDGVWTLVMAAPALLGFIALLLGVALFDFASRGWDRVTGIDHAHKIHVVAAGFIVTAIALALAFGGGALGELWPEERT